jgi:hypothetical protein
MGNCFGGDRKILMIKNKENKDNKFIKSIIDDVNIKI